MSASLTFLKNVPYTCLLGPSNSGKTEFFLEYKSKRQKIIVSNVPDVRDLLPLNYSLEDFIKSRVIYFNLKQENKKKKTLYKFNNSLVLVDEIHFFSDDDFLFLQKICEKKIKRLFVSLLPGSFSQEPMPNTEKIVAYANYVRHFPVLCAVCSKVYTSRSGKINSADASLNILQLGKHKFQPVCFWCAQQQSVITKN